MAKVTLTARMDALESTLGSMAESLAALATLVVAVPAPVTPAPKPTKAEAPFIAELRLKHAARTETPDGFEPCGIHSPAGAAQHEGRAYAADGTYVVVA